MVQMNPAGQSDPALALLVPGEYVLLEFEDTSFNNRERLWCEICDRSVHWPPTYTGHIRNRPALLKSMISGQLVRFAPEHIFEVLNDQTDTAQPSPDRRRSQFQS